ISTSIMSLLSTPLRRAILTSYPSLVRTASLIPRTLTTTTSRLNNTVASDALKKPRKQWRQGQRGPLTTPIPFRELDLDRKIVLNPNPKAHDWIKFIAANLGYSNNPKSKATVCVGGELSAEHPEIVQIAIKVAALYGVGTLVVGKNGLMSARRANKVKKDRTGNGCILVAKELSGRKKKPSKYSLADDFRGLDFHSLPCDIEV